MNVTNFQLFLSGFCPYWFNVLQTKFYDFCIRKKNKQQKQNLKQYLDNNKNV